MHASLQQISRAIDLSYPLALGKIVIFFFFFEYWDACKKMRVHSQQALYFSLPSPPSLPLLLPLHRSSKNGAPATHNPPVHNSREGPTHSHQHNDRGPSSHHQATTTPSPHPTFLVNHPSILHTPGREPHRAHPTDPSPGHMGNSEVPPLHHTPKAPQLPADAGEAFGSRDET